MKQSTLMAIFDKHEDAAIAVENLINEGIPKEDITVLGKGDLEEYDKFEFNKENEDALYWGKVGAFWGGLFGFFAGGLAVFLNGQGPLFALEPLIGAISGLGAGAIVIGLLAMMFAWYFELGISKVMATHYRDLLESGKNLLIVQGGTHELKKARKLLKSSAQEEMTLHLKTH
ncbi:MAG TPA: hypothetical protein ENK93_02065 [Campylobacteraceae bacterium]|nr:hypothetical protein [Campylobacteraceae bacterium]